MLHFFPLAVINSHRLLSGFLLYHSSHTSAVTTTQLFPPKKKKRFDSNCSYQGSQSVDYWMLWSILIWPGITQTLIGTGSFSNHGQCEACIGQYKKHTAHGQVNTNWCRKSCRGQPTAAPGRWVKEETKAAVAHKPHKLLTGRPKCHEENSFRDSAEVILCHRAHSFCC